MPTVLVVDDSRLVAQKIRMILEPLGIDTVHAGTVAQVFGYRGQPSLLREQPPDLIVLDIMMPDMNGFDTLYKLQSMVKVRDIPVMMFSASSSENHVIEAIHRGAKAFLSKPLNGEKFLTEMARVAKEANLRELAQSLASYLAMGVQPEKERPELQVGEANLSYLLEIIDEDEEMLRELVQVFVEDMPGQVAAIEQAVKAKDARAVRVSAHLFKGSVSNFAAVLITEKALAIELMGRNEKLEGLDDLFAELQKDADQLHKELMAWLAF